MSLPTVTVIALDGPKYTIDYLDPAPGTGQIAAGARETAAVASVPVPGASLTTPPPKPSGRTPAQVLADLRTKLAAVTNAKTKALAAKILSGQSFAAPGKRDTELQRAASIIGFLEPDEDPDVVADILSASIKHWQDTDAGTYTHESNMRWAAEKVARAQAKKREDRAGDDKAKQAVRAALTATARQAPRGVNLPPPPDDPTAGYTKEEIDAFAAQQETGDFRKRWIIQKGEAFWVFVNGRYQAPVTRGELKTCIYTDLAPADGAPGGVNLWTLTTKGDRRYKTPDEILHDYASVARNFETTLMRPASFYESESQKFVEATAPLRAIEPHFHLEIDTWLRHLGGAQADKLLDWVAAATRLDKQCAALFLFGAAGTGKTMLANGLSRLWATGGPTELKRVLGDWSADLARCPLILADEQIPDLGRGRTSADLRELVGSSSRTLTRKYLPNSDLTGAIRLVLASNNFSMLSFGESLSSDDLAAVAGRFVFIKVNHPARDYLQSISTDGWVDGDLIAEHALWLRDNRQISAGRRFLVEGQENLWTKLLAVQGRVPSMVAEWLARCLADQSQQAGPRQRGTVLVANGELHVNTNALIDFWDLYVKNQRQPDSNAIIGALRNLSSGQMRHANLRHWVIDTDTLIAWADEHLIASEIELRTALTVNTPIPASWLPKPAPAPSVGSQVQS